ncbi:MAG: hypothetical protein HYV07_21635 [Deltaproteobacteria bacterium]|nr:hypothetical protein [Deltaproteobacteria bacterium]
MKTTNLTAATFNVPLAETSAANVKTGQPKVCPYSGAVIAPSTESLLGPSAAVTQYARTTFGNDGSARSAANLNAHQPASVRSTPAFPGIVDAPSLKPAKLSEAQLGQIATKKAVCPFMGSAVKSGDLPVRNSAEKPLALVSDVVALGDSGGGNLGSRVLSIFARGNHDKMLGVSGKLDAQVPTGSLSLDLSGSQGSHPGHSGILQKSATALNAGRLSAADFARLESKAKNGLLTLDAVGQLIAENLAKDPAAKVFGLGVTKLLAADLGSFVATTGPALLEKLDNKIHGDDASEAESRLLEKLTKLLGEDNLIGSAGEFGLMFAFLANKPGTQRIDGKPAIELADVKQMFVDHKLPEGWREWPKTASDWVKATTHLTIAAGKEYHKLTSAG